MNLFKKIKKKFNDAKKTVDLPIQQVLTPSFVYTYTGHRDIYEFLNKGGFDVSTPEEILSLNQDELDTFVNNNTEFNSFKDMISKANREKLLQDLNF